MKGSRIHFFMIVFFTSTVFGQTFWTRTEPYMYGLNEIRFGGGDTLYGTLNSGFTRSFDNGTTWSTPVIVNYVQDIALSPNGTIFLAQNQQRMSRSTNRGSSWTIAGTGITETSCSSVMVSSHGTVFAGTQSGIYRSTNNGDQWTKIAGSVQMGNDTVVSAMATSDGNTLYAFTRVNSGSERGVAFRSTDDGLTWTKGTGALTASAIYKAFAHANGSVFVRTGSGAHYSSDGGNSWHPLGFMNSYIGDIAIDPSGAVYVTISESNINIDTVVYKTTNNGLSWTPVKTPTNGFTGIHINKSGHLFLSQDQTYRSLDHGGTWKALPILYPDIRSMKERGNGELYFSTGSTYGAMYRSNDFGGTWGVMKLENVGTPVIEFLNDTLYVADTYYQAEVRRSTDGGKTFTPVKGGLSGYVHQLLTTQYKTIIAGTSNGVYRSVDGTTWTKTGNFSCNVNLLQAPNGTLFGARNINGAGVIRSLDSGSTWHAVTNGMTNLFVRSLVVAPNGDLYNGTDNGIYRSIDNGDSWVRIDTQKTVKPYGEFLAVNRDGILFAGGTDNSVNKEVYQSSDRGASWTLLPQEIAAIDNQASIRQLFCTSNGMLFAGTVSGLFRTKNRTTGVAVRQSQHQSEAVLMQNYPNPFNPSTAISYAVPSSAAGEVVLLRVYDQLGRAVATLVNERKDEGRYTVLFDGSSLASGIYYYRLRAGGFGEVKRMILLK